MLIYWSLIKGPISLMNGCTAFLGYSAGLYLHGSLSFGRDLGCGIAIFLAISVFSGGAAILNNYQDRHIDTLMTRTCHRPIPLGLVSAAHVLPLAIFQIVISIVALAVVSPSLSVVVIALAALFLYNGLYTPLKKKTLLAFIPGLISGSLPPIIGWIASGGPISLPVLSYIGVVLILWQIPHYWLLLLSDSEDLPDRILPSFYSFFSRRRLADITYTWVVFYSLMILLIPVWLYKKPTSIASLTALLAIVSAYAGSLIAVSYSYLKKRGVPAREKSAFLAFNFCSLFFFLSLSFYFFADTYWIRSAVF